MMRRHNSRGYTRGKHHMAGKRKSASGRKTTSAKKLQIGTEQYRSMILGKLRTEIDTRRAKLELAAKMDAVSLANMAYWKMGYWKMKYWKMGHEWDPMEAVVLPAISANVQKRVQKKAQK